MKQPPPTDSLGARNHWRRVLWVILIVVLVLLARRMAGGADAWQTADQLLSSGNAREATVAYEKLIRQKPDDARGYLGRGRSRWRLNQLDGAIADFSKVIELDPKSSVAYNNRGLAYHDQGKHGQALADYSMAIELNPKGHIHYFNRALTWKAMKEMEKAVQDCSKAVELDPKYLDAYVQRSELITFLGDYEQALADADKAISLNKEIGAAWFNRATACDLMGEDDLALEAFDKAVELAPKMASYHNNRGFFLLNHGRNEEAVESFNKALEVFPDTAIYLNNRGQAWLNLGEHEKAMADFNRAIQSNPQSAKAFRNRAGGWLAMGDAEKAAADATKCLELLPTEARAYRIRAEVRRILGDESGAEEDVEHAMILGPQPALGMAAWVSADLKKRDEEALKTVLENGSPENRVKLATARHDHAFAILDSPHREPEPSALEEAVAYARSATILEPENAAHWFLTGLLYEELSKHDERALPMAEQMFEKTLEIDEEHTAAWLELGMMLAEQDRGMEAIPALERTLELDPARCGVEVVGRLCALYAANDEGFRGVDFFDEQFAANPEVSALAVGRALMLDYLGDREAALSQARDVLLIEEPDTTEHAYAAKLVTEWEGGAP